MSDLIDRDFAIKALDSAIDDFDDYHENYGIERAQDIISCLPSAQPERKTGEWIPEFDGKFTGGAYWFSCSKCKRIVPDVRNGGWNYCPNCGADMRERGQDE